MNALNYIQTSFSYLCKALTTAQSILTAVYCNRLVVLVLHICCQYCCHPLSTAYIFYSKTRQSLISLCITSFLESASCLVPLVLHKADDVILSNSSPTCSPLASPSFTHSLFHSRLKTHFFHKSFPP